MELLGYFISFVIVLFLFGIAIWKFDKKKIFIFFLIVVLHFLFYKFIFSYIGFDGGTPRLPAHRNVNFEERGIYSTGTEDPIVFYKEPQNSGFAFENLGDNDSIKFQPSYISESNKINYWTLNASATTFPLRINGKAINIYKNQWLQNNDTLELIPLFDKVRLQIIYQKESNRDKYTLSHIIRDSTNKKTVLDSYSINFTKVKDGIKCRRLFSGSKTEIPVKYKVDELVLDNLLLFREKKNNTDSKLCFLFKDNELYENFYSIKNPNTNNIRFDDYQPQNEIIKDTLTVVEDRELEISYGYGYDLDNIKLSKKSKKTKNGATITPIYYKTPKKTKLPLEYKDSTFLITTWDDFINYDYIFRINSIANKFPFFAKATLKNNFQEYSIISGDNVYTNNIADDFFIDNGKEGVILSFAKIRINSWFGWNISHVILLILAFSFIISCSSFLPKEEENNNDYKVKVLWSYVVYVAFFLALIKLIITYRIVAFTPEKANLDEISVFHKSLKIAIGSLFAIPFLHLFKLIIIVKTTRPNYRIRNFTCKAKNIFKAISVCIETHYSRLNIPINLNIKKVELEKKHWLFILIFCLLFFISIGSITADKTQSAFDGVIRANLLSIAILFVIMRVLSPFINKEKHGFRTNVLSSLIYILSVGIVAALNFFVVKDLGFFIYLPVFILIPFLWLYWNSDKLYNNRKNKIVWLFYRCKYWVVVGLGVILLLVSYPFYQNKIKENIYRIKANNPDYILERAYDENVDNFNIDLFRNNIYQMWQFEHYAAHGTDVPKGYANAKIIDTGATYPTTLTDGFFSTYILSEHGIKGGIVLLLLFIAILILFSLIAFRFHKSNYHKIWLLMSVAFFIVFVSIYMALANMGFGLFTGQNIPFFGLNSIGDSILFLFLLCFSAILIFNNNTGFTDNDEIKKQGKNNIRKAAYIIGGFLLFGFVFTWHKMSSIDEIKKEDFNLTNYNIYNEFKRKIDNGDVDSDGNIRPGVKPTEFERSMCELYRENKKGLLFRNEKGKIEIDKNYFKVSSPFTSNHIWKGEIYSSNNDSLINQLCFLNSIASVEFNEDLESYFLNPDNNEPRIKGYNKYILPDNRGNNLLVIENLGDSLILESKTEKLALYLNGEPVYGGKKTQKVMRNGDIVMFLKGERKYYFTCEKVRKNLISRLSWVNGSYTRIHNFSDIFSFSYLLGKAGNIVELNDTINLNLTVDLEMQQEVQNIIKKYAKNKKPYSFSKINEIHEIKQIAFTVIDSYTGEIITLGAWPNFNPNDNEKITKYLNSLNYIQQERVLRNPNLRNHNIGSTFKPLAIAAMGVTFNQKCNYDIADLSVYHPSQPLSKELQKIFNNEKQNNTRYAKYSNHAHHHITGINYGFNDFWDCKDPQMDYWINTSDFLTYSRNYYMLTMFNLGTLDINEGIDNCFFNDNTKDLSRTKIKFSNNKSFWVDICKSQERTKNRMYNYDDLDESFIFSGMDSLYNIYLLRDISANRFDTISETWSNNLTSFLPIFSNEKKEGYLKHLTPYPVNFMADIAREGASYIKAFPRGGGDNRWNNIQLTEAFARLSTGYNVSATLQRDNVIDTTINKIVLDDLWRYNIIIRNLHNAVQKGTSKVLKNKTNGLYMIAKTGTVKENDRLSTKNSEMLMFTLGEFNDSEKSFIRGKTYTCYLYMEEAPSYHKMDKFDLAAPLISYLSSYINDTPVDFQKFQPTKTEDIYNGNIRPKYKSNYEKELSKAFNKNSGAVRNFAVGIAGSYGGTFNPKQVCAIYDYIINRWNYVNDPNSYEYYATAEESINNGFNGDCDDFAILIGSAIKSIGGQTLIATGCNSSGCHAWSQLLIPDSWGNLNEVKNTIISYYKKKGIFLSSNNIHTRQDNEGIWLNLDWQDSPNHVGSSFFKTIGKADYIW